VPKDIFAKIQGVMERVGIGNSRVGKEGIAHPSGISGGVCLVSK